MTPAGKAHPLSKYGQVERALRQIRKTGAASVLPDQISDRTDFTTGQCSRIMRFTEGIRYNPQTLRWDFTGEKIEVPA